MQVTACKSLLFLALRTPLPGGHNLVRVTHARDGRGQVPGRLALIPTAWTLASLWLAARRVYGEGRESRVRTTGTMALLAAVYFIVAAFGLIATLIVSLLINS